ncbi:hypothetical protein [Streptomyces albidoflavus]|uniref:hypothetical protein n=1 Tax=Streptomyces albidoflavus TaxID=1886 RepID=UPI00101E466A|nr:hypothetical protein [Streptomyces albidoflavus]
MKLTPAPSVGIRLAQLGVPLIWRVPPAGFEPAHTAPEGTCASRVLAAQGLDESKLAILCPQMGRVAAVGHHKVISVTDEQVGTSPDYVLRTEAIRWAIDTLTTRRIHPFFLAYLYLHGLTPDEDKPVPVLPVWTDLGKYLTMPGGPSRKPYYRPFFQEISKPERYWLNANLAGSYAPSSLRQVPRRIVDVIEDGRFQLKEDSAELALEHLLFAEPAPLLALSTFMLRNYGFKSDDGVPGEREICSLFLAEFNFREGEGSLLSGDALVIFTTDSPTLPAAEIFTLAPVQE